VERSGEDDAQGGERPRPDGREDQGGGGGGGEGGGEDHHAGDQQEVLVAGQEMKRSLRGHRLVGVLLIDAHGVDGFGPPVTNGPFAVERDVLARMEFRPLMTAEPALMDERIFADAPMNLRPDLLELPLEERLAYDPAGNVFFVNFEGLAVRSKADIERIHSAVEQRLQGIGHKVYAIVNYDRFSIVPELTDEYIGMVKGLMDRHYLDVTRYTSSTFLRLKLGEALARGHIAPHLYSNVVEAQQGLAAR
jgi:hypothetical protein